MTSKTRFYAQVNTARLRRRLTGAPRAYAKALRVAMTKEMRKYHAQYSAARLRRYGPSSVAMRTGNLMRSFTISVTGDRLSNMVGRAYFDATHITVGTIGGSQNTTYAHTLEFGAVIRPKRAKALTIPVPGGGALTPAGVLRGHARDFDLQIIRTTEHGTILGQGDPDQYTPFFYLRQQSTVPEKLRFISDWNRKYRRQVLNGLKAASVKFYMQWKRNG